MTDRQAYIVGGVALVATGIILYTIRVRRYGKKEKVLPKPQTQPSSSVKVPSNTLGGIIINPPTRTTISDRQKFFDGWIAEEGGADSIREMYAKRPDRFSQSDIAYLQSKGVLPKTDIERLIGRGL